MNLPNAGEATIAREKIVEYLLSPTHSAGRSKAAFFAKHGFSAQDWQALAAALRAHAADNELSRVEITAHGTRFVIDGPLGAPDGERLNVRSVWFISRGAAVPRFATAHPLPRTER